MRPPTRGEIVLGGAACAAAMRARRSAPASRTSRRTGCTRASRRRSRSRRTSCSSRIARRRVTRGPLLKLRAIRKHAAELIQRYDVRGGGPELPARQLSGGNLQKVVLAREFEGSPRVLVVASPTRGLDVAAIETVHRYLREAAEGYVGVLLISEDLDEILALADRVAVMYEGAIVGERDARTGDGRGARAADGGRRPSDPDRAPARAAALAHGRRPARLARRRVRRDDARPARDRPLAGAHVLARSSTPASAARTALNETFISATPLLFTGLCAAVAFRMQLFNIGGEGQLYAGAILGAARASRSATTRAGCRCRR